MSSVLFSNTPDAIRGASGELSSYVHTDYDYNKEDWDMIRDCIMGERRIKEMGTKYLPGLDIESGTTYDQYKERATFVNMVGRTVQGLVGTVFRRPVKVDDCEKEDLKNVTRSGLDFNLFCKTIVMEVCAVGRVVVLVDMEPDGGKPYMTEYIAENILSWRTKVINGREQPNYVLLREIVDNTPVLVGQETSALGYEGKNLTARYRALYLDEGGTYRQRLYREAEIKNEIGDIIRILVADSDVITPSIGGKPFDVIPVKCIGPVSPTWGIQKSPVLDITTLNLAHYRTSAQLEHGRFFTALPVYYIPVAGQNDKNSYDIGPSVVWEVPENTKPGILEYFGTGLKNLADSLVEKEEHIAQLGGRIMGIRPAASTESDNIFKMKQANEMSILLNITESTASAMTAILRWYLMWQRKKVGDDLRVRLNQDFKALQIAARELRAVALLYQSGILPVDQVFRCLQDAEWLDDEMTLEEFTDRLDNLESFPNQPDVEAMHEGYPDAKTRTQVEQGDKLLHQTERQAEMDREHQALIDKRKADQQWDQDDHLFEQAQITQRFEQQHDLKLAKEDAKAKVAVAKAKPKPAAAAKKPAAKKPVAKKK